MHARFDLTAREEAGKGRFERRGLISLLEEQNGQDAA
jgi:hypothetical protein